MNSIGKYGIKCEESANVQLSTENCTVENNDMQFIFLANSVYFDTESVISNNKATMLTDKACFFESIQDSLVFLYGTEITDNHAWKQAGVILADATTLIIWHAVFSGNSAGEST